MGLERSREAETVDFWRKEGFCQPFTRGDISSGQRRGAPLLELVQLQSWREWHVLDGEMDSPSALTCVLTFQLPKLTDCGIISKNAVPVGFAPNTLKAG